MLFNKNIRRMRSPLSNFITIGLAAAALFLGTTATIKAQTKDAAITTRTEVEEPDARISDRRADAPAIDKTTKTANGGAANKYLDFTGNGRTDFVTLGFTDGGPITWHFLGNPASPLPNQAFLLRFDYGLSDSDLIVPGDFIGDNKADLNVFRTTLDPGQGIFYVSQFPTLGSSTGLTVNRAVYWGKSELDGTVSGDYDGDGKADFTVVRYEGNKLVWYILSSAGSTTRRITYGQMPAVGESMGDPRVFDGADFNGDGRDELIYATTSADGTHVNYYVGDAVTGVSLLTPFVYGNFNTDTSLPPADYTGDGRADFAAVRFTAADKVYIWYVLNSATGELSATRFGIADPAFINNDFPLRGDYDGDNRQDIAVWRPSNQTFYWISSQNGSINSQFLGQPNEFPLAGLSGY